MRGSVDQGIDAYFSWPGIFAAGLLLTQAMGVDPITGSPAAARPRGVPACCWWSSDLRRDRQRPSADAISGARRRHAARALRGPGDAAPADHHDRFSGASISHQTTTFLVGHLGLLSDPPGRPGRTSPRTWPIGHGQRGARRDRADPPLRQRRDLEPRAAGRAAPSRRRAPGCGVHGDRRHAVRAAGPAALRRRDVPAWKAIVPDRARWRGRSSAPPRCARSPAT